MGKALSGELSCPCDRSCCVCTFTFAKPEMHLMTCGSCTSAVQCLACVYKNTGEDFVVILALVSMLVLV